MECNAVEWSVLSYSALFFPILPLACPDLSCPHLSLTCPVLTSLVLTYPPCPCPCTILSCPWLALTYPNPSSLPLPGIPLEARQERTPTDLLKLFKSDGGGSSDVTLRPLVKNLSGRMYVLDILDATNCDHVRPYITRVNFNFNFYLWLFNDTIAFYFDSQPLNLNFQYFNFDCLLPIISNFRLGVTWQLLKGDITSTLTGVCNKILHDRSASPEILRKRIEGNFIVIYSNCLLINLAVCAHPFESLKLSHTFSHTYTNAHAHAHAHAHCLRHLISPSFPPSHSTLHPRHWVL